MQSEDEEQAESARQVFDVLMEISKILDTQLDAESLIYCIKLCESGIPPESLAHLIVDMQNTVSLHQKKEAARQER